MSARVPAQRIRVRNRAPINPKGKYVLYWMTANRRTRFNFALQRAVERAQELNHSLVILETLTLDQPYASARFHRFGLDGMADNRRSVSRRKALYYPYVETQRNTGRGLLAALSRHASLVIADWYPTYVSHTAAMAEAQGLGVRLEEVDSNGLLPVASTDRTFSRAVDFRRHVQRSILGGPPDLPRANPLARTRLPWLEQPPKDIVKRWPLADPQLLRGTSEHLSSLPLDRDVAPTGLRGGNVAGNEALERFLDHRLPHYGQRNQPQAEVTSGLSPYLHAGHLAAADLFLRLTRHEGWTPERLGARATGARSGFWGLSPPAEAWLDQLVTWRELGFHTCHGRADAAAYDSLPAWALETLAVHARDPRPHLYNRDQLEAARTHDPLWNAAQRQLRREGVIHNYLRMLWGKKILEWSPSPQTALDVMLELNDRYALDGRDPNSLSGIFWVLGRYDRPWGPERPIFGKVRYMSSGNTARKVRVQDYLRRYGAEEAATK